MEPITIIYITSIGMLGIFIYVILNTPIPITPSFLLLMTSVYLIGVLLNANHMFHISYPEVKPSDLLKEIKRNAIDFKDLEITGVCYMDTYPKRLAVSYSNALFREPYLRLGVLNAEPVKLKEESLDKGKGENPKENTKPFYFFLARRSSWGDLLPRYRKYRKQWRKWQAEEQAALDSYTFQFDSAKDKYYIYFITLEKRLVFNQLFKLLVPTEVRIVFYKKTHVFKELQPIPGREYPPEALECMEKINTMYP